MESISSISDGTHCFTEYDGDEMDLSLHASLGVHTDTALETGGTETCRDCADIRRSSQRNIYGGTEAICPVYRWIFVPDDH
jgi:hypothetical protein